MLKKTITFPDLDGEMVTEDFYFNLTTAEIAEMQMSQKGGFSEYLQTLIKSEDGGEIIKTFKAVISSAVGKRSDDNRRFIKNQEIRDEFMSSEAYSILFMELITSSDSGATFIRGIVPQNLVGEDEKGEVTVELPEDPIWVKEDREPTKDELVLMTPQQLRDAFRRKSIDG